MYVHVVFADVSNSSDLLWTACSEHFTVLKQRFTNRFLSMFRSVYFGCVFVITYKSHSWIRMTPSRNHQILSDTGVCKLWMWMWWWTRFIGQSWKFDFYVINIWHVSHSKWQYYWQQREYITPTQWEAEARLCDIMLTFTGKTAASGFVSSL